MLNDDELPPVDVVTAADSARMLGLAAARPEIDDRPGADLGPCNLPGHVDGCPGGAGGDHEPRDGFELIDDVAYTTAEIDAARVPWDDDDDRELRGIAWSFLVTQARAARRAAADELAAGSILLRVRAAESGLVPSPDLPDNIARQRELLSMPLDDRRIESSTYQAQHDAFEYAQASRKVPGRTAWPIFALGLAVIARDGYRPS